MSQHCRDETGIVSALTGHFVVQNKLLPDLKYVRSSRNSLKLGHNPSNSDFASSALIPNPFTSNGRLATTQYSYTICGTTANL
jgi:hypothetical protein